MAFTITATAQALSKQTKQSPMLVVEIEGIDLIFGTAPIFEFLRWDDGYFWDTGLRWDGTVEIEESRSYISLSGTSKSFSQQLNVDRAGGANSVSGMNISLVDKAGEISSAFSFNNATEILGRKATVYLGYSDNASVFPNDFIPIIKGFINDYANSPGLVDIGVTHPENLKRQSLFKRFTSQLNGAINSTQTTITVETTDGLLSSQDLLTTYVRVGDELMEVTSILSNTQLQVIRGRLDTIAASHDDESETLSVYNLAGNPIDLTLKLLLSDGNQDFFTSLEALTDIVENDPSTEVVNGFIFDNYDIERVTGLVAGDIIQLSGTSSNNGTFTVNFLGTLPNEKSYIVVNEPVVSESFTSTFPTFEYRSQYNTLNEGLGLLPDQVDIAGFIDVQDTFGVGFFNQNFFLVETVEDAKTFIDTQIMFPNGMYSIPRKAAVSVKYSAPPLTTEDTPILNTKNIRNFNQLKTQRSTHKYYYNEVLFNFNFNPIQEKRLDTLAIVSNESKSRVKVGNKALSIEANGADRNPATTLALTTVGNRIIDRYRFAAKYYKGAKALYKDTFNLEVGDIVALGGEDTKLPNLETGERSGDLELYEVINKNLNINGEVSLDLLSTNFGLVGRFAVFSPASKVLFGSTNGRILLGNVFENFDAQNERDDKWSSLIGVKIRVYSEDYDYDETTTLLSFDTQTSNGIIVDPLPSAPLAGYVVEIAEYTELESNEISDLAKQKYTFTSAQTEITSVTSSTQFSVASASDYFEGQLIYVHSDDYLRDSNEVTIDTVVGSTITLTQPLNITPQVGDKLEALGFEDNLDGGYRFV